MKSAARRPGRTRRVNPRRGGQITIVITGAVPREVSVGDLLGEIRPAEGDQSHPQAGDQR